MSNVTDIMSTAAQTCNDLVSRLARTHLQRVWNEGIGSQRLNHRMPALCDLENVTRSGGIVPVLCFYEFWSRVAFLRGYLRKTEEAVRNGELVYHISQKGVVFVGDL